MKLETMTFLEASQWLAELLALFVWRSEPSIQVVALDKLCEQLAGCGGVPTAGAGEKSVQRLLACGYNFQTRAYEGVDGSGPAPCFSGGQISGEAAKVGGMEAALQKGTEVIETTARQTVDVEEAEDGICGTHEGDETTKTGGQAI